MPGAFPTDPAALAVAATVRSFTAGTALCDGVAEAVRFVHDPRDGRIIMPLDPRLARCEELVLCLPDDSFETRARALLKAGTLPEHDLGADVYLAYHAEPPAGTIVHAAVDSVKLDDGRVIPGDAVCAPNPLWGETPALCRALNADADRLRDAVSRATGADVGRPLAVGIDPLGIDVRARFGVVRVAFERPVLTPEDATRAVDNLLGGGSRP